LFGEFGDQLLRGFLEPDGLVAEVAKLSNARVFHLPEVYGVIAEMSVSLIGRGRYDHQDRGNRLS
jgi:hypothetical protein